MCKGVAKPFLKWASGKGQLQCKATGFWKTNSKKYNFLLLAHEYIFIFKK